MIPFVICIIIALFITPYIVQMCNKHDLYDMPNNRKIHKIAIPRLGGIVFMPITAIGMIIGLILLKKGDNGEVVFYLSSYLMIVGAMLIYIIGLIDDLRGLTASRKFIIQVIAALIFPTCNLMISNLHGLFGIYELPLWISYPLTVFTILLIVNAMNLIDGIDGLSSCLSIIMLLAFAFLFHELNAPLFVLLSISLCGAIIGFFYYNYYGRIGKNKIFMGDTGSLFIGFVIAYLAIKYQMNGWNNMTYRDSSLLTSITLVFIPCIDVIRVALTRLFKGKKMFSPDKTHIHHIIMQMNLSAHQALYTILILYIAIAVINWGLYISELNFTYIFLTDIFIYSIFIWSAKKIGET
mgnify:CR=1 FL=1